MRSRDCLLTYLFEQVKFHYELRVNPLGLEDSFTKKIRDFKMDTLPVGANASPLDGFYEILSAIYRFKHGDNQLDFLWDGSDHSIHYEHAWSTAFKEWIQNFCRHDLFIQAVLDLTVFLPENRTAQMTANRMNHFIAKHFDVKMLNRLSGLQLRSANA